MTLGREGLAEILLTDDLGGGAAAMETVDVAVIGGDGIGPEVTQEAERLLEVAAAWGGRVRFRFQHFDWGCQYYLAHGEMMPKDGIQTLSNFPVILLGAVGFPTVPDHISLWGLLLPIRREFDQYVNLRPVRLLRGVEGPLRRFEPGSFNFVVIRENTEGEYSNVGGRLRPGTPQEVAVSTSLFTRYGTERVIRYAFERAQGAPRQRLTAATKSNGITYTMPFWDEVFREVGREYPQVSAELVHIDALAAFFVQRPDQFDVVVASNLFGDILTDLGGAIQGSIGMAASANLNPERKHPSMFEPVHGSAPDIAGRGVANPIGALWSAALLLEHVGEREAAARVIPAIESALERGIRTRDLGGTATTREFADAVLDAFQAQG